TSVSNVISEYWLPLSGWNGRYEVVGRGGTAGSLGLSDLATAVGLGYAAATDIGKQVIQAFYGAGPQYSYFTGCSTGGAEALSELQRYPNDFDGIVGGAPASQYSLMWPGEVFPSWVASTYTTAASGGPTGLQSKMAALNNAAL